MSDIVFVVSLHYVARELDEPNTRERVQQALNLACADLEKYSDTQYIDYKIREMMDLE